jgi:hypothetical protein
MKLTNFFNDGFGWQCRACTKELGGKITEADTLSRLMSEGEAESKEPSLSLPALARWADAARSVLECRRCGITELYDKS